MNDWDWLEGNKEVGPGSVPGRGNGAVDVDLVGFSTSTYWERFPNLPALAAWYGLLVDND